MADPTPQPFPSSNLEITHDQAQLIVQNFLPKHENSVIAKITKIRSKGYRCVYISSPKSLNQKSKLIHDIFLLVPLSFTSSTRTYIIDLINPAHPPSAQINSEKIPSGACFLTIAPPSPPPAAYTPNSLPVTHSLLNAIRSKTSIPLTEAILDTSLSLIPYHFLLSGTTRTSSDRLLSIAQARKRGLLSEKGNAFIDLELGKFLGQLHTNVQNDWFGVPLLKDPADPSYSWQETFTDLFEKVLSHFEKGTVKVDFQIPYENIRLYHSRAIGFSVFDDVEVPSLIWVTGSEDDIFISLPTDGDDPWSFEIAAILPVAAHAVWGDPLLESFFVPPHPSKAMAEGYMGAGGGALTIFPRQNTKRLWYNLFLALLVLYEIGAPGEDDELKAKAAWCQTTILDSVDALKNAPYY